MLYIFICIVVVLITLVVLFLTNKNMQEKNTNYEKQVNQLQSEKTTLETKCEDILQEYTKFQKSVEEEKENEKAKEKRRRVTKNDREFVLERDNETCQICGISKAFMNDLCKGLGEYLLLEIDHIQPVSKGGTGKNLENLQCLCWRCNRKKGDNKTNAEVRASITYGVDMLMAHKNWTKKTKKKQKTEE